MSNDKSAAEYLKILKRKASKTRREWAIGRLLQICARRSDVDFCDDNRRAAFRQVTPASLSTLKYALGKSLYKNDELADAKRVFGLISSKEDEWLKATYFIGVIAVKGGDLKTSLTYFKRVLTAAETLGAAATSGNCWYAARHGLLSLAYNTNWETLMRHLTTTIR